MWEASNTHSFPASPCKRALKKVTSNSAALPSSQSLNRIRFNWLPTSWKTAGKIANFTPAWATGWASSRTGNSGHMRKKRYVLLLVLLVGALGTVVWLVRPPREPAYQGKPLSAWLKD